MSARVNIAELLRQVADELEEQNDSVALSLMGSARLKRLIDDLHDIRNLRRSRENWERSDKVKRFLEDTYIQTCHNCGLPRHCTNDWRPWGEPDPHGKHGFCSRGCEIEKLGLYSPIP